MILPPQPGYRKGLNFFILRKGLVKYNNEFPRNGCASPGKKRAANRLSTGCSYQMDIKTVVRLMLPCAGLQISPLRYFRFRNGNTVWIVPATTLLTTAPVMLAAPLINSSLSFADGACVNNNEGFGVCASLKRTPRSLKL
jgi:hypothetical protein